MRWIWFFGGSWYLQCVERILTTETSGGGFQIWMKGQNYQNTPPLSPAVVHRMHVFRSMLLHKKKLWFYSSSLKNFLRFLNASISPSSDVHVSFQFEGKTSTEQKTPTIRKFILMQSWVCYCVVHESFFVFMEVWSSFTVSVAPRQERDTKQFPAFWNAKRMLHACMHIMSLSMTSAVNSRVHHLC